MVELCYLDAVCLYKVIRHINDSNTIDQLYAFTEDECIECRMVYPINCKHLDTGCTVEVFW